MLNALLLAITLAVTIPPAPADFISDGADLLTPAQEQQLRSSFEDAYARQGTRLGLLTLSDLDDEPKATAVRTLNYWQMSPDSVLLLVSMNPRKIFLQPGSNLSYKFTEDVSVGIIRNSIAPALKAGHYSAGISSGFQAISDLLPRTTTAPPVVQSAPVTPDKTTVIAPVVADGGTTTGHPFLIFLLVTGLLVGGYFLVQLVLRKNREAKDAQEREEATYRRMVAQAPQAYRETRGAALAPRSTSAPAPTPRAAAPAVVNQTTVIHDDNSLLNAVVLNDLLTRQPTPAPRAEVRAPPPSPPRRAYTPPPSPPSRSSGGGGSSWDSGSSSDSSSSYGGGGSDFGGGGSDGGGGGGGDF